MKNKKVTNSVIPATQVRSQDIKEKFWEKSWSFDMSKMSPKLVIKRIRALQQQHDKRLFALNGPIIDERNLDLVLSKPSTARREGWYLAGKRWLKSVENLTY